MEDTDEQVLPTTPEGGQMSVTGPDEATDAKLQHGNEDVPAAVVDRPYHIGSWKGQQQYRCPHCPFDSLHEDVILDHIEQAHMRPASAPPSPIIRTDRYGNEVK